MSEQPETSATPESNYETDFSAATSLSASSLVIAQETMEQFLQSADVQAVYGEPVEHDGTLIIPTAEILNGMAFGVGSGGGSGEQGGGGTGGGGGGGGRVLSRPVAVIVAGPAGVEVKPIVDITKIAMAGLTAFGFVATMLYRMTRPPRRH
jgi:uncharacterized spore protein YtfJ